METMTRKKFEKLAGYHQPNSVSIYIATNRIGNNDDSRLKLKNQIQNLRKILVQRNLKENQKFDRDFPVFWLQRVYSR
ncbi:MAG: hypothetical protein HC906_11635 [Bacteroidales bacterium]|nr:hypothetical protein [Bacteroidales bacterium]